MQPFTNSEMKVLTEVFYRFQATDYGREALVGGMQVPSHQLKTLSEKVTAFMCGEEVEEKAPSKAWQEKLNGIFADLDYAADNVSEVLSTDAINIAIGVLRHIDWETFIQIYNEVKDV